MVYFLRSSVSQRITPASLPFKFDFFSLVRASFEHRASSESESERPLSSDAPPSQYNASPPPNAPSSPNASPPSNAPSSSKASPPPNVSPPPSVSPPPNAPSSSNTPPPPNAPSSSKASPPPNTPPALDASPPPDASTSPNASSPRTVPSSSNAPLHPNASPSANASPSTDTPASFAGRKRKSLRNSKRAAKRLKSSIQAQLSKPSKRNLAHALSSGAAIEADIDASKFEAARGAHTGNPGKKADLGTRSDREKQYTVAELLAMGFEHIQWDGVTPIPIVDCCGRIIAVLAGQPGGDYPEELQEAFGTMLKEGENAGLSSKAADGPHKRGAFPAYNRGVTMGMGNAHPVVLNPKSMTQVLNRLVGHSAFRRMARYQNAAFGLWAPRVYEEYEKVHNTMHANLELPENFPGVVFAAAAFNFGGDVWTFKHRDSLNWAFGWCAITALGKFDAAHSAQLVLWELRLVIDFPHAATVLLPSAVITHSNTPVADGDIRTSFTQYTAGAIFRWVENGCRTEEVFEKEDPEGYAKMQRGKSTAYIHRLENFSTVDELLAKV